MMRWKWIIRQKSQMDIPKFKILDWELHLRHQWEQCHKRPYQLNLQKHQWEGIFWTLEVLQYKTLPRKMLLMIYLQIIMFHNRQTMMDFLIFSKILIKIKQQLICKEVEDQRLNKPLIFRTCTRCIKPTLILLTINTLLWTTFKWEEVHNSQLLNLKTLHWMLLATIIVHQHKRSLSFQWLDKWMDRCQTCNSRTWDSALNQINLISMACNNTNNNSNLVVLEEHNLKWILDLAMDLINNHNSMQMLDSSNHNNHHSQARKLVSNTCNSIHNPLALLNPLLHKNKMEIHFRTD